MGGEQAAFLLVGVSHVLGAVLLIWMLTRAGGAAPGRGFWFGPDPDDDPIPPQDPIAPGGAALTLPHAQASDVRLRGPGRLADARPLPPRRPEHAPDPARAPERT
jgi:hypothetical protein